MLQFQKRFEHGWTFQVNYTRSKALGIAGSAGTGGSSLSDNGNTTFRDPRNWSLDKQIEPFNQTNAIKASGTFELPFGPGKAYLSHPGVLSKIAEKWQFGGILTVTSGTPLSATASAASTFTFGSATNTPAVLGALPANIGSVTRTGNGVIYFPTLTQVKDPQIANLTTLQTLGSSSVMYALAQNGQTLLQNPTPGQLGNLGLGMITGPSLFDLDLNMLKRITIKERYLIEFRVDAIGSTNTPHFAAPTMDINSTSFGRIVSAGAAFSGTPAYFEGNRVFVANLRVTF